LANLAREAIAKNAETTQKYAQANKAMAESGEIVAKRDALNSRVVALTDSGMSESQARGIASNEKAFADTIASRNIATPADYAIQARALGFDAKPFLKDYSPDQIQAMEKGVFAHKAGIAQAGATNVIYNQGKEILKNKADLAGEVEKEALGAPERITFAQNLRTLLPKAFTGVGSDVLLQGGRVAEAFGIDVKGVAPSQIIDQILNKMTIGEAGQLKGSLSDKDRDFLKATIGTRGLSIKTLNYVADEIERRASIDRKLNSKVNDYVSQGKNLNNFNFAEERSSAQKEIQKDLDRLKELRLKAGQPQ
jgi:predicted fused transcriptional regulator/phosphomethylpyrimidine kinase